MHSMFGEWYRHATIEIKSEELALRWKGIENVLENADEAFVAELTRCFLELPSRNASFVDDFRKPFFAEDATFRMQSNDVEIRILCGAALVALIQDTEDVGIADVAAATVIAAVAPSFRKAAPIPDIVNISEQHLFERSADVRTIKALKKTTLPQLDALIEPVTAACATNATAPMSAPLESALKAINKSFRTLATETEANLTKLESAHKVQAEESDMIWWIFGQRSKDREHLFWALRRNLTGGAFQAAFERTRNSVLVAAMR